MQSGSLQDFPTLSQMPKLFTETLSTKYTQYSPQHPIHSLAAGSAATLLTRHHLWNRDLSCECSVSHTQCGGREGGSGV